MSKKNNFDDALKRLSEIQHIIQSEDVQMEKLGKLINEAAELVSFCKTRLREIEDNLNEVFNEL